MWKNLILICSFALLVVPIVAQENNTFDEEITEAIELYWNTNDNLDETLLLFTELIEATPDQAILYGYRATIYRQQREYNLAYQDLERGLDLQPNDPLLISVLARVLNEDGQHEEALDAAWVVLDDSEASPEALYNAVRVINDPNLTIHYLTEAIEVNDRPVFFEIRALAYRSVGQLSAAMEDYTRIIELDPKYSLAYVNLGNIYRNGGQVEIAIELYTQGITQNPDSHLYGSRSMAMLQIGNFEQAIEDANRAVELGPRNNYAYYARGTLAYELGNWDEAMDDLNTSIELNPNYNQAFYNRGVLHGQLDDLNAAIEDYSRAIELAPQMHEAYQNRGSAYRDLGQYELALADFEEALDIWPEFALALHNRGRTHSAMGHHEEAIDDYLAGLAITPNYKHLHNSLGIDYWYLENYEKSIESYTRAIELDPNYATAYYGRYVTFTSMGKTELAQADLQRAMELGYEP